MDIKEGNKLIIEFMGYEWYKGRFLHPNSLRPAEEIFAEEIRYHSSWDWLMPVCEKIESIHEEGHGYFGVHISSNCCTIQGSKFRPEKTQLPYVYFSDSHADTKIGATWQAVVDFIKWYNKHNKK